MARHRGERQRGERPWPHGVANHRPSPHEFFHELRAVRVWRLAALSAVPIVILGVILALAFPGDRGAIGGGMAVAMGAAIGAAAKNAVFVRRLHQLRQPE